MNYKLPILTAVLGLYCTVPVVAQQPPPKAADGRQLVAQAAVLLLQQPSVSAKLRQRVQLFGHELVGAGHYLQATEGSRTLFRFDVKMPIDGQVASLQQVVDGRFLWIRRQFPEQTVVGRVDLRRLKKAMDESSQPTANWLAMGGLPYLLEQLAKNFQFQEPKKIRLGELNAYQLEGVANNSDSAGQGSSAAQRPDRVTLVISDQDLFPYQLTFWKSTNDASGRRKSVPVLSVEFFEIQIGAVIDPLQFVFKPTEYEDYTQRYLAKFGVSDEANNRTADGPGRPKRR